ncbi:MAG: FAD-binding oxidoreductase [candidate division Zixibacteria bacterium]|jgi:D-lactate dehydrogenase (cytochrome)|nr:FAD-binding oxidoreductase [candidate division Zixibacteria bacterium]
MTIVEHLTALLPSGQVSTQIDQLRIAARDESSIDAVMPKALVWAQSTEQVQKVVQLCIRERVPITTRGAGSALEGSTIPSAEGIVLDVSRMTDIRNYWPEDLQVEVEPGLIYDHLNERLKRDGLFFPPSPGGSGDLATIGGMVSTNASGIYSVKYGGTRDYILALEVVTGTGELVKLGNRAVKRSSGYNLVELMVGSEGTLGVITSVTLKLAGIPEDRLQSAFRFPDEVSAARAVSEMRRYGLDIAAIEFLDRRLMEALNRLKGYGLDEVPALFLEFHGPRPVLESNSELAESICVELGGTPLILDEGHRPWEIRHWATDAIKHRKPGYSIIRNDVAFPISKLPEMVEYCHRLGDEAGIMIFTFGHVGMGLLHALMLADPNNQNEWRMALDINNRIIEHTIALGGTISGEHGIGLGHKDVFGQEHGRAVELMRKIKRQFDPHGIMNPGKIFDLN